MYLRKIGYKKALFDSKFNHQSGHRKLSLLHFTFFKFTLVFCEKVTLVYHVVYFNE